MRSSGLSAVQVQLRYRAYAVFARRSSADLQALPPQSPQRPGGQAQLDKARGYSLHQLPPARAAVRARAPRHSRPVPAARLAQRPVTAPRLSAAGGGTAARRQAAAAPPPEPPLPASELCGPRECAPAPPQRPGPPSRGGGGGRARAGCHGGGRRALRTRWRRLLSFPRLPARSPRYAAQPLPSDPGCGAVAAAAASAQPPASFRSSSRTRAPVAILKRPFSPHAALTGSPG